MRLPWPFRRRRAIALDEYPPRQQDMLIALSSMDTEVFEEWSDRMGAEMKAQIAAGKVGDWGKAVGDAEPAPATPEQMARMPRFEERCQAIDEDTGKLCGSWCDQFCPTCLLQLCRVHRPHHRLFSVRAGVVGILHCDGQSFHPGL